MYKPVPDGATRGSGAPYLVERLSEPGRRIELLSPDYKAGALPLSYPGGLSYPKEHARSWRSAPRCPSLWPSWPLVSAGPCRILSGVDGNGAPRRVARGQGHARCERGLVKSETAVRWLATLV